MAAAMSTANETVGDRGRDDPPTGSRGARRIPGQTIDAERNSRSKIVQLTTAQSEVERGAGARTPGRAARLADGTPYYGALGEMSYDLDEDKAQCHLCGKYFHLVGGKHILYRHGITLTEYRELFELPVKVATCSRGQSEQMRQRNLTNDLIANAQPYVGRQSIDYDHRAVPRWRSLAAKRPDMLALWHPTRNGNLDPWTIGPTSSAFRPWWRCSRRPAVGRPGERITARVARSDLRCRALITTPLIKVLRGPVEPGLAHDRQRRA
jgi:hypothetical protein